MDFKFKRGDKVRVVNYGHRFWSYNPVPESNFPVLFDNKEEGYKVYDMSPELIGQEGIIVKNINSQGMKQYSLEGIKGKSAWYDEQQLEKV